MFGQLDLLRSIHDPRSQDQLASDFSLSDLLVSETSSDSVVGSINQNNMDERHAHQEWQYCQQHDAIIAEELLCSDISATHTNENNGDGIRSTPPAHQECRFVVAGSFWLRSLSDEALNEIHNLTVNECEMDMKGVGADAVSLCMKCTVQKLLPSHILRFSPITDGSSYLQRNIT